jgi:hypothetical protein
MDKVIVLCLLLASCSMEHHLQKAERKGYRCDSETIERTTYRFDTIRDEITNEVLRVDTLYIREVETRQMSRYIRLTRQERKAIQDSMRHVQRMKDKHIEYFRREIARSNKEHRREQRTARVEARVNKAVEKLRSKRGGSLRWFFIGVIVGAVGFWQRKNIWSLVRKFVLKV